MRPAIDGLSRETRAAIVEALAARLISATFGMADESEARSWLLSRMRSRWRSVWERYPKPMDKLRRFCAPSAASARAASAAASGVTVSDKVDHAVRRAAAALRALEPA